MGANKKKKKVEVDIEDVMLKPQTQKKKVGLLVGLLLIHVSCFSLF